MELKHIITIVLILLIILTILFLDHMFTHINPKKKNVANILLSIICLLLATFFMLNNKLEALS
jgi:hypothetical protein